MKRTFVLPANPTVKPLETVETVDFSKGVFKANSLKDSMIETFRNGKKRGDSTRFAGIDDRWTWLKTELTVITGFPNHGKSEIMFQMMLAKSLHDKWKWVIYSPENQPIDMLFDQLINSYVGKGIDFRYPNCMTESEYLEGIEFVSEYFTVIYPTEEPTPDTVMKYFEYVIENNQIDGSFIDPWNQLIHSTTMREDQYLSNELTKCKRFAEKHNICFVISSHPKSTGKNGDGSLPVPDQYSLSGGAMWNNKADNILAIHRPNYHTDKMDTTVDFYSHKIKKQKLVGLPGMVSLNFERKTNRYYINGFSPLTKHEIKEEIIPF
jgi:twinkle protein